MRFKVKLKKRLVVNYNQKRRQAMFAGLRTKKYLSTGRPFHIANFILEIS